MYIPKHFGAPSDEAIEVLIKTFPLANLLTACADEPSGWTVNPVPVGLFEPLAKGSRLWAHVARANPLWEGLADQPQAILMFNGPSAYITPNAYPSKQATHRVVPTYNYTAVQLTGRLTVHHDAAVKQDIVERLTNYHEREQPVPWSINEAPADYLQAMLKAIVGLEFTVETTQAKWKVSQNRPTADQQGVIADLERRQDLAATAQMAALVRQTTS